MILIHYHHYYDHQLVWFKKIFLKRNYYLELERDVIKGCIIYYKISHLQLIPFLTKCKITFSFFSCGTLAMILWWKMVFLFCTPLYFLININIFAVIIRIIISHQTQILILQVVSLLVWDTPSLGKEKVEIFQNCSEKLHNHWQRFKAPICFSPKYNLS